MLVRTGWILAAALLASATVAPAHAAADRGLAGDVDSLVQKLMSASGIPGLAIAVVQGDRPVLVKGYGFADLERRIPVSENTVFYIASMTKAFTALTVALMADRKALDLDAPISRYLKDVQWGPGVDPDSITLRQLLSHTSGIEGDGPVTWRTAFTGVHTHALLKDLLRYHPANGIGHAYRYMNLDYNIAGLIVEEVNGGTWQDAMTKNVLAPLRMSGTTPYVSRVDSMRLALPYLRDADGMRRVRYAKADGNMHAAGGLATTAADLAKWLEVQINLGRLDGRQVFPRHVVAETQRLQTPMDGKRGEFKTIGYTLGWNIGLQGSDTILVHGGGFSAFKAEIAFDRRTRVGVAVATNEPVSGGGAAQLLLEYTLDRARDPEAARRKYAPKLAELPPQIERIQRDLAAERARRASRQHALNHPLEAYAGTYESPMGGVMTWSVRGGRLWAEIGVLESVAEVYDHTTDRLRVELEPGMGKVVTFRFADGRATAMELDQLEYVRK